MPLWRRIGWLLERKQKVSDLEEELAFHLEEETDARRNAGVTEVDARRAARLDLGNPVVIADDTRAACLTYIEENWTDMRPASLVKFMEENSGR